MAAQANKYQEELFLIKDNLLRTEQNEQAARNQVEEKKQEIEEAKLDIQELQACKAQLLQKEDQLRGEMEEMVDKAKIREKHLEDGIQRLVIQADALEREASEAQEETNSLKQTLLFTSSNIEQAKEESSKEVEELQKVKNRWAAAAKELRQQLEHKGAEVMRLEAKLSDAIKAKEEALATVKTLTRRLVAVEPLVERQLSIVEEQTGCTPQSGGADVPPKNKSIDDATQGTARPKINESLDIKKREGNSSKQQVSFELDSNKNAEDGDDSALEATLKKLRE
ncbi:hypothetical protein BSKO_04954 [Bryopsis sp. KO-2023]|nr:hypothetical protein BSKO_04954 [Bryopsis sp. KO-2023]